MKYELTPHPAQIRGQTVFQIRALRDIDLAGVQAGEVGGYVHSEANLSQEGECWIYGVAGQPDLSACALDRARVEGDCRLHDRARVEGHAHLSGFILMADDARVRDQAVLSGVARLSADTVIYGNARIHCGEDGPQILPGVALDFDVQYGLDYVTFGFSYSGHRLAVSQSGRLCLNRWDADPWSGDLAAFRTLVGRGDGDAAELRLALAFAELYLGQAGQA